VLAQISELLLFDPTRPDLTDRCVTVSRCKRGVDEERREILFLVFCRSEVSVRQMESSDSGVERSQLGVRGIVTEY
jgi:hypothetical protein